MHLPAVATHVDEHPRSFMNMEVRPVDYARVSQEMEAYYPKFQPQIIFSWQYWMRSYPANKSRVPLFDNLKYLMICGVVCGHAMEIFAYKCPSSRNDWWLKLAYFYSSLFAMPLFIIASGYMSRLRSSTSSFQKSVLFFLLYLEAQMAYQWFMTIGNDSKLKAPYRVFTYEFLTWYLMSMFLWKLMAPMFAAMRFPVTVSVTVGLLAGYTDAGDSVSMARTLAWLPFYVLGYNMFLWTREYSRVVMKLRAFMNHWATRVVCVFLLFLGVYVTHVLNPSPDRGWTWLESSYNFSKEFSWWHHPCLERLKFYVCAAITSLCAIQAIPRGEYFFTSLGTRSMYPFLYHPFILWWAHGMEYTKDIVSLDGANSTWCIAAYLVGCVLVATVLSSRPAEVLLWPTVNIPICFIYHGKSYEQLVEEERDASNMQKAKVCAVDVDEEKGITKPLLEASGTP